MIVAIVSVALLAFGTVVRATHWKMAIGLGVDDEPVKTHLAIIAVLLAAVVAILGVSLDGAVRWLVIVAGVWAVLALLGAIGRPWHAAMQRHEAGLEP